MTLPPDLIERLDAAAAADDRTRSAVVRRILRAALDDNAAPREISLQTDVHGRGTCRPAASRASGHVGHTDNVAVVDDAGRRGFIPPVAAGDFSQTENPDDRS